MALADPVALISARLGSSWALPSARLVLSSSPFGDIVVLVELPVSVLHFNVICSMSLVNMGIVHIWPKTVKLDLLGKAASTSHNGGKERCVAHFPELECQINGWVAGKVVAFTIEAKTCHILSMTFQDLPLGRRPNVIDSNRSIVGTHCKSLCVVVERNHWEYLYHVWKNDRHVFVAVFAQGKLIWIQAAQEDLDYLDQILFKVLAITIDEVPQSFKHILLMLLTWTQCCRMELNQLQKVFGEADSDL